MNDTKVEFSYTNSCTCEVYDEINNEYYCYGYCYDDMIENFKNITLDLFELNETGWWKINNFRLWNGDHSGFIQAYDASELLRGMVVNSEWTMRGEILKNEIHYSLSHHDAPMGSSTVVTIVEESELDLYGLA